MLIRENFREYLDHLLNDGYTVRHDEHGSDPDLIDPGGNPIVTWQEEYPYPERLDREIAAHAKGWTIARMPLVDAMVMRIAGYELIGRPDVPVAVVLDEAVELAKRFSTDDSGRFVNGVLSAMVPVLRPGPARPHGRDDG